MRKHIFTSILLALSIIIGGHTAAQQAKPFTLKLGAVRGSIQWEQSSDRNTWTNIGGGTTDSIQVQATKTTYYRAKITEAGCAPVYSGVKAAVAFNDTMYGARLIKGKVEIPAGSAIKPADCIAASVLDTSIITQAGNFEMLVPDSAEEFTLVVSNKAGQLLMLGHFIGQKDLYVINTEESAVAILLLFPGLKPVAVNEKPTYAQLYKKELEFQQLVSQVSALQLQGKALFENISDEMLNTVHTLVKKSFNGSRMRIGSSQSLNAITIRSHSSSCVAISNLSSASYIGQIYNQDGEKVGSQFNLAGKIISGSSAGKIAYQLLFDRDKEVNTENSEVIIDLKNQLNLVTGQYEIRLRNGLAFDNSAENTVAGKQNLKELVVMSLLNYIPNYDFLDDKCLLALVQYELTTVNITKLADAVKERRVFLNYVWPLLAKIEEYYVRGFYLECLPKINLSPNKFIRGVLGVAGFLDKYLEPTWYVGDWLLSEPSVNGCQYLNKDLETSDCFQLLPASTLNDEYMAGDTVTIATISKSIKKYYPFSDEGVPFKYFDWEAKDGYFIPGDKTTAEGRTLINNMDNIKWVLPCDFVMADANATIPGVKNTAAVDMFFTKVYVPELKLIPAGNKQEESVNKQLPANLSIQIMDTYRNTVFSPDRYIVKWEVLSGKGKIEPISPSNTSAKWTLGTDEGEQKVKVTVKTKTCDLPIQDNSFIFSATALGANSLQIYSGNKQVARPTAYLTNPIKVLWRKADGTRIANGRIDWVIESGGGTLDNATSYTDNNGIASNSWRLGNTGIQKVKVTAKKDDGTDTDGSPLYFEAVFGEPYVLLLTGGDNQKGIPNTELKDPIEVQVNDADGNPLPGVLVNWSIVKGNGQLRTTLGITNSEGKCNNNWTLGATGEQEVKASVKNSSNQEILFSPATFNATLQKSVVIVSGNNQQTTPNTYLTEFLIVRVLNDNGNPISGVTVQWSIISGGGSIETLTVITDNDGLAKTRWKLGSSGEQKVTATVKNSDGSDIMGSPVLFIAKISGPKSVSLVSGDNQGSAPDTYLTDYLIVKVLDETNASMSGVTVQWSVVSGGGSVESSSTLTDNNGLAKTKWKLGLSGDQQVKATVKKADGSDITGSPIVFNAGFAIITTIAGNGTIGYSGDGGDALNASIYPSNICVDQNGNVFFATINRIRKINKQTGIITTVAGDGNAPRGEPWQTSSICPVHDGLPATSDSVSTAELCVDKNGNVYFGSSKRIRRVDATTGVISTIIGPGIPDSLGNYPIVGRADSVFVGQVRSLVFDEQGNLFFIAHDRVFKLSAATNRVSVYAGNGSQGNTGDGGPATAASFYKFGILSTDKLGNLYIVDDFYSVVRKVTASTGIVSKVAGIGIANYSGDGGPAVNAALATPTSVAFDSDGNILISDYGNYRIRRVNAMTGIISTVIGTGQNSFSGDGGNPAQATLGGPRGVYIDKDGYIYISDWGNARIRKAKLFK